MSDPHEWHIAQDKEGFFIEDEYGEEVLPHFMDRISWPDAGWRCQSYKTAQEALDKTIQDALDNYEPPDPPGWEGGFAGNH